MTHLTSHSPLNLLIYIPLDQRISLLSILIKICHFINLFVLILLKDFIS